MTDIKREIADEAVNIVSGARRAAYGKPEQNFARISRLWNAHFVNIGLLTPGDAGIEPRDVAILMDLMKTARLAESPDHKDSVVDKVGYALTYAEMALGAKETPQTADREVGRFAKGDRVAIVGTVVSGKIKQVEGCGPYRYTVNCGTFECCCAQHELILLEPAKRDDPDTAARMHIEGASHNRPNGLDSMPIAQEQSASHDDGA